MGRPMRDPLAEPGWADGLFGCFNNVGICLLSFVVPCYVVGKNSEALDGPFSFPCWSTLVPGLNIFTRTMYRAEFRVSLRQDGTVFNDCLLVTFCACCTIAQEARTIKHVLGEDMARQ